MTHLPGQTIRAGIAALLVGMTLAGAATAQEALRPDAPVAGTPATPTDPAAVPVTEAPVTEAPVTETPVTETPMPEAPAAGVLVAEAPASGDPVAPAAEARDPALPHDLSPMGMFLAADWVVKGVMIGLAVASVITWTILLAKMIELWAASRRAAGAARRIAAAPSLAQAAAATGTRADPVSRMIRSADAEYRRSASALAEAGDHGVKERVESQLERIELAAGRRMARGTGVLATIGSTAPFVGLFGTVWGIMNSFIGISESQTTNLAVVAPGIAEALLATAIGLVAAIPAVVIYNVFARAVTGYRMRLGHAAAQVRQTLSRDLDFRGRSAAGV
ncbi:tonB-system energizer ExbB [Paracoccus sp. ME4]|uniref:tonB-system energizer ExbB n=1 Tax=Paracoccus sp. ME4 TaxID=3138066 RepID=UPI00398B18A3